MIADLLAVGDGVRAIGRKLGRAASTISREVRRNRDKDGRYRPHHAEQAARARAGKPRKRRIVTDAVLGEAVCGLLAKRWSPEQVAHELRELLCGERARWLCSESIYQGDVVGQLRRDGAGSITGTRTPGCSSWRRASDQPLIPHFVAA